MIMCVKRAGLVWALVLLTATCFILTCAAPNDPTEPAEDEAITTTTTTAEPPAVSTTPPVKSMDEVDSSNNVTTDAPAVSDNLNEYVPSADQGYLYYEIKKRIYFERNLTLSDIQYVLSQKDEEGQFMFALADKLGYISGDKHDDPHIPVIRSHREKLIELLKKMAATKESKPPSQQEHNEGPTVSSDETPASKEPASPSDSKKIGYNVSADIRGLGSDAIRDILSDPSFSDLLGYTVGMELGYPPKDERMKYLENVDTDELKEFLQRILKLKTASENENTLDTTFDSQNEPKPSERGQEAINGNGGSRQGEESDLINEGDSEPSNLRLTQSDDDPQNSKKQKQVGATKAPSVNAKLDKSKPGPDDVNGAGGDTSAPKDSDPFSPTSDSEENENHGEDQAPGAEMDDKTSPKEGDVKNAGGKDGDPDKGRPSPNNIPDDERMGLFSDDDDDEEEEHMHLLNSDEFQNFLETKYNELYKQSMMDEADPNAIDMALEKWLSEKNDEKGGGDEPKAKEDEVEYDRPRSSSSFGALHFLGIFLVLGAVVVIGYLCMHNRKKLREGVATYIKDSSKRRRRAREYKPLIST